MTTEKLLTPAQVADRLGLSIRTVREWLRQGKLKGVKLGSRGDWRVNESELKNIMKEK